MTMPASSPLRPLLKSGLSLLSKSRMQVCRATLLQSAAAVNPWQGPLWLLGVGAGGTPAGWRRR